MMMTSYFTPRCAWIATARFYLAVRRPSLTRAYNLLRADRYGVSSAHFRPLRIAEFPRVVGLLRRQRVRDPPRARVQRHPQRRGADRHLPALQVPRQRP